MARGKFLVVPENPAPMSYETTLPTDSPIAIYYRQSTDAQVGNISTTLQTVDMVRYLKLQGWTDELITMIDMDAGVSGTTKIDERPGMKLLYNLINEKKIKAVACQDEDRLFRDVTQIQVNVFIEACRKNRVIVMTPSMVYNFHHEPMGAYNARQFRFKSEMAAEYIRSVIKGTMMRARQSLLLNGQWAGGAIPIGFMVDMRKTLPDGSRNEHYKKYAVFEPYAMVVREYFQLYQQYSGNVSQTLRHIHQHGSYYPDPATCPPPEGFKIHYVIEQNRHGWCPGSKQALLFAFTNPAYIGHWVTKNTVIRWNNHPPLVDEETFFFAFNRHSSSNLDGSENLEYRNLRFNDRPSLDEERPEDRPLLSGLIFSDLDGKEKLVGTQWRVNNTRRQYFYVLLTSDGFSTPVWSKDAGYLDATVIDLLLSRLRDTFDFQKWEEDVNLSMQGVEADLRLKQAQLTQVGTVMDNLVASLASLTTPQLIGAVEKKYQDAQAERERLNQEVAVLSAHIANVEKIKTIRDTYQSVIDDWETSTRHMQREIVHSFIEKVKAEKIPGQTGLHLTIHWRDGSKNKIAMGRKGGHGTVWLPQDAEKLLKLVNSGASQLEIAQAFPNVRWKNIYRKHHFMTQKSLDFSEVHPIHTYETYNEYVKRVGSANVGSETGSTIFSPAITKKATKH